MGLDLNAVGKKLGPVRSQYNWKDVALYGLGVGAGFEELEYVYEERLKAIPTFAILSMYHFLSDFFSTSGVNVAGILHGEHELIVHNPIPAGGARLVSEGRIRAIYDKGAGKGALVVAEVETCHEEGHKLFTNVATLFSRLDGGFGGDPGPRETFEPPQGEPDFEEPAHPSADQPLIYRLSWQLGPGQLWRGQDGPGGPDEQPEAGGRQAQRQGQHRGAPGHDPPDGGRPARRPGAPPAARARRPAGRLPGFGGVPGQRRHL